MDSPDRHSTEQRRVDDPRRPAETPNADPARRVGTLTRFVDPYDMRAEPQPEEPGYGHGV